MAAFGSEHNEDARDALIRHQIALLLLAAGLRDRAARILDATEPTMRETIVARLRRLRSGGQMTPGNVARVDALVAELMRVRGEAWADVRRLVLDELRSLAAEEPRALKRILTTVVGADLAFALPEATDLRRIVGRVPFEGYTAGEWLSNMRDADLQRIRATVRSGAWQREGGAVVARRVVGTVRAEGRNGIVQRARNDVQAITRTLVNGVGNRARELAIALNVALIGQELYVAVLDSRTTPECRARDGRVYRVGEGPIPPIHVGCRSSRVPWIGPPPAERYTYGGFLRRQSVEFQNMALGPTRALLFRRGKLSMDRFVDPTGRALTLAELARFDADAFRAAGLDPLDFRP